MRYRGRIQLVALLSALVLGAFVSSATAPASIPGFGPLHNALFRVTFSGSIASTWEIPEYVSVDDYCYVERKSGSGKENVTFPTRTNPYHALDYGHGPVYLQPNTINGGGIKPAHVSRTGDILYDETSSGNPCNPSQVPPSSHADNSGCGNHVEDWTLPTVIIAGSEVRPEPAAQETTPFGACPVYQLIGWGFPTGPPYVQEKFPHILALLAHKRSVVIIHGKQTFHHKDAQQHVSETATVTWTLKIKRLNGSFTG